MKQIFKWIFFTFQIPAKPAYIRVKVWRALKTCGAISLKGSVYALPHSSNSEESFEWIRKQIMSDGGSASLFLAEPLSGMTSIQIKSLFIDASGENYIEWIKGAEKALKTKKPISRAKLNDLQNSLKEIQTTDFFACPKGLEAKNLFEKLKSQDSKTLQTVSKSLAPLLSKNYQAKIWVTRKGVQIDRLACIWLIKRFIDKKAKIKFVDASTYQQKSSEIRFDMFEAEFTHVGDLCSFEVLVQRFLPKDSGLLEISKIIHDLDINDNKYQRSETLGIAQIIKGIIQRYSEDEKRVSHAGEIFESIYAGFNKK